MHSLLVGIAAFLPTNFANMYQISVLAFVALAAAIPHVLRDHAHGRRAYGARPGSIADRWDSYDGSCGTWGGATCKASFCCG